MPLALADAKHVAAPPSGACRSWSALGQRWLAVDASGAVVGEARVTGREYYEVSHCFELTFKQTAGNAGSGVYVASDAGYRAAPSAAWSPGPQTRDALRASLAAAERAALAGARRGADDPHAAASPRRRPLFFRASVAGQARTFAVVGGAVLFVFEHRADAWTLVGRDTEMADTRNGWRQDAYRPRAVFDMNGDGVLEIIVRRSEGEWWNDSVYSFREGRLVVAAEGVFGSSS